MDDDRICDKHERTEHIVLTCKNHPNLTWSTKNIAPIGARSIFYNLYSKPEMGPECECPLSALVHKCNK